MPQFSSLNPELAPEQLALLLQNHKTELEHHITQSSAPKLLRILNNHANELEKFWSPLSHLNSVIGSDAWRNCYQQCLPLLTEHDIFVHQNHALFIKLQACNDELTIGEQKMLQDFLLNCQLSGINLSPIERQSIQTLFTELDDLSQKFQNNIIDSMKQFSYQTDNLHDLDGLPEHIILNAQQAAAEKNLTGYYLHLDQPTYLSVITYAHNQALRQLFFQAYGTRASEKSNYDHQQFDNTKIIKELLAKRQHLAELVAFPNYAEYSLCTKMAKTTERVTTFLNNLNNKIKHITALEVQEITEFARSKGHTRPLEPWDMAYFIQIRQQELFNIDQEALRAYFPLSQVIQGLNELLYALYGLEIETLPEKNTWHPDVVCYQLKQNQQVIGQIYCDWFARAGKRGGAWMDTLQTRCQLSDGTIQPAITTLTCNFAKPAPNQEAGLTHEELLTLLHEFGHCLHHLLSEVNEFAVSGVHSVEWDAVELPSQWMENWGWVEHWLNRFSYQHSFPHEIFLQLFKVKNDLIGLYLSRQILFASYDMFIHSNPPPYDEQSVHDQYLKLLKDVAVWPIDPNQRFPQSFSHIFAGGYAAGYYSYLWADVLSSDAFAWFESDLSTMPEKGALFRKEILAKGGSIPALEAFIAFRGREPLEESLLKAYGLS